MSDQTEEVIVPEPLIEETIEETIDELEAEEYFNNERTLTLIRLFKNYKPLVAAGSIKTMKQMWEIISADFLNEHQLSVTPQKCENRIKVLERGYKKMKDKLARGERPKKLFPYYEEFQDMPLNKKYAFVPGLNSSNYSTYTTVNFNNTVKPVTPVTYIKLSNVKQDIDDVSQTENSQLIEQPQETSQQILPQQTTTPRQPPPSNMVIIGDIYFNRERTLALIDLYKKYNEKYCERAIKTKRRMWYIIAREMTSLFKIPITGSKCENKLKVLERNYKRGTYLKRRYEFEDELKAIFGDRVVRPPVVKPSTVFNNRATPSTSTTPQQVTIRVLDPKATIADKIETVLLGIRSDFQIYYRERLNIERDKLSLKRQKLSMMKDDRRKMR